MCDFDLFGEVVITLDDVNLYLDSLKHLSHSQARRKAYLKNYNVASIIKGFMIDNKYHDFINDKQNLSDDCAAAQHFAPRYANDTKPTPCPAHYHQCSNPFCAVYIKAKKRDYSRFMYEKRKKERL